MKIFMSHSSKQKLFVKELKKYLPNHLNLWIDEKEVLIGSKLDTTLESAIYNDCDLFILVVDEHAIKSAWVMQEVTWALEKEKKLNRVFLLPIVLEEKAWEVLNNPEIKNRKHLTCFDFTDTNIEALSKKLMSEILGWLCYEYENKNIKEAKGVGENQLNYLTLIDKVNDISEKYSQEIKRLILPYRRKNPLKINVLYEIAFLDNLFKEFNFKQFVELLSNLQSQNKLKGIYSDGEIVYLQRESFGYKENLYIDTKKEIAQRAFQLIQPGQVIAIDGGSTTLELTKLIAKALKLNDLYDLKVVTNSLTVVNEILAVLSELNVRDNNDICNVYLVGGRARSISFTIVPEKDNTSRSSLGGVKDILDGLNGADISFLGTNGIKGNEGFAITNPYELRAKKEMIQSSAKKVILCDPSKFEVTQELVFANFDDNLTIVTVDDGKNDVAIKNFVNLISNKKSELIIA